MRAAASISCEKIADHAGSADDRIRPALNILAVNDPALIERFTSARAERGVTYAARLIDLDGYRQL